MTMQTGVHTEDLDEEDCSVGTSTPGTSTLAAEKELSGQEDDILDNHNDGTGQEDTTMPTTSSSAR